MQTEQDEDIFQTSRIKSIFENVHNYVEARLELYKISLFEKGAKIAADLITAAILGVCAAFFLIFLSVGIALILGNWLGGAYIGFLIVAGVYLIIGLVIYLRRKSILQKPIMEAAITELLKGDDED